MSTQEQKDIAARTLLEHAEAKNKLAALQAKAHIYGKGFRALGEELAPYRDEKRPSYMDNAINEAIEGYPSRQEVTELMSEMRQTQSSIERLAKSLQAMGYNV